MTRYKVQIMGGIAIHKGDIAEYVEQVKVKH